MTQCGAGRRVKQNEAAGPSQVTNKRVEQVEYSIYVDPTALQNHDRHNSYVFHRYILLQDVNFTSKAD